MIDLGTQKTWIIVRDGPISKNHSIDAQSFAKILNAIQGAIDQIALSKCGADYDKNDYRLYVREIVKGSAAISLSPLFPSTDLKNNNAYVTYVAAATTLDSLIAASSMEDAEFCSKLNNEVPELELRRKLLASLYTLASFSSPVEIKTSLEQPECGYFVPSGKRKYFKTLINSYVDEKCCETIQGIITRIRGDDPCEFTILSKEGHKIRCFFDSEMEEKIAALYKKWISVTGDVIYTKTEKKIEHIASLSLYDSEILNKIGRYPLKNQISFHSTYDTCEKWWSLSNDELALSGFGTTYSATIESLEEDLEGHIICLTEYSDDELSKDSILLKKKLMEYIDFDLILEQIDGKYGFKHACKKT